MNLLSTIIRRVSPAFYIKVNISRIDRQIRKLKAKDCAHTSSIESRDARDRLMEDRHEFEEWQREIDDKLLAKRAGKIGIYLDEIEFTSVEDERNYGLYYYSGMFGNELFRNEFRKPLLKAVREREPIYRKEKREQVEIYIKLIAALTGILGTAIGVIAIIRK